MADDKVQPTIVIASPQTNDAPKWKKGLTKKHVLVAGIALLITALVVVGVVVGIHVYTSSQLKQLEKKYSMTMKDKDDNDVKQDVSADVETNVVQYKVEKNGIKATILQDFDKGIEVTRVEEENGVMCYVAALNRSNSQEPSSIPSASPNPGDDTPSRQLVYKVDDKPLKDISYLGQRVVKLCENVPTHWMVPSCDQGQPTLNATATPATNDREKRATVCATCGGYYCVCGCCWAVCGRFATSTYSWYYSNGVYYCRYYMYYVSCGVYLGSSNCYLNGRRYYYPWS